MPNSPHFSNGALLLKDSNTDNWYYLSVGLLDSVPYISPGQTAVEVPEENTYAETIVLKAPDETYYRVGLYSLNGQIHSSVEELTAPEPPNRIFLRNSGILYELVFRADEELNNYLTIVLASSNTTANQCSAWRLINPISNHTLRTINPVSSTCIREVLVLSN